MATESASLMLTGLQKIRTILFTFFEGYGIGSKFPILWKTYDWLYRFASPKKKFYHEISGNQLLVDLTDPNYHMRKVMQSYSWLKEYEPNTTAIVKEHVKPGHIALDIGANIGFFSQLLSRCVGDDGKVISIEPTESAFKYLCENTIGLKRLNVLPFKVAAWDKNEPFQFPISILTENIGGYRRWANGLRLDDLLSWLEIKQVDFIKIDVDGSEPKALRGLTSTIENNPRLKMVIEYYPKYILEGGGDPQEVISFLDKYFTYEKIPGDYGDGYWNYFCIRK
jgi:FkbM family methyltransferase